MKDDGIIHLNYQLCYVSRTASEYRQVLAADVYLCPSPGSSKVSSARDQRQNTPAASRGMVHKAYAQKRSI